MTTIYLSGANANSDRTVAGLASSPGWAADPMPLLLSFAYRQGTDRVLAMLRSTQLMLDSGAYTAHTLGKVINLRDLIAEAKNPRWTEVVSLDVISDWQASKANAETMSAALGYDRVIPVFHMGEPWQVLADYCARWRKVGLGGLVGQPRAIVTAFLGQVFARSWPKRFHIFGVSGDTILGLYPFESADAASWVLAPNVQKRGVMAGQPLKVTDLNREHGIAMLVADTRVRQARLRARWQKELARL